MSKKKYYWVSCSKFTVMIIVVNNKIIDAAPVINKFVGQPLDNLSKWMNTKFEGYQIEEIYKEKMKDGI